MRAVLGPDRGELGSEPRELGRSDLRARLEGGDERRYDGDHGGNRGDDRAGVYDETEGRGDDGDEDGYRLVDDDGLLRNHGRLGGL